MSAEPSQRDPIDRLAEEFVERFRRGERPSASEYAERFPELASQVGELLSALALMEQLGPGGQTLSAPVPPSAGRLGEYRLGREIGRGGMGIVYEAEQESLGRRVALKVLPGGATLKGTQLERFRREAKAAARLHHSNIVPVFGVGEQDGVHYFAMQYIDGAGLDSVLRDIKQLRGGNAETDDDAPTALSHSVAQPDYFRNIARIGLQTAEALAHAHAHGVLHRDVKPANILLDVAGTAWLGDFGLAHLESDDGLTNTGDVVGTLRYLSPERLSGPGDARSDVYSLGLTLYELLTLRPAFDEADRARLTRAIANDEPHPPRRLDATIPRDLETIVLKAIAKEPRHRYQTAAELTDDLRNFLSDRPIAARRIRPWERACRWARRNPALAIAGSVAIFALVIGLALTSWQWRRADRERDAAERRLRSLRELLTRVGDETADWPGNERLRLHLLQQALAGIAELADEVRDDPQIFLEQIRLHLRLAALHRSMSDRSAAIGHAESAARLLEAPGSPLGEVDRLREQIATYDLLDSLHEADIDAHRDYPRRADEAENQLRRVAPDDSYLLQIAAKRRLDRGVRAAERGEYGQAEKTFREAIQTAKAWHARTADDAATAMLAAAYDELAMALKNQRRLTEAREAFEMALALAGNLRASRRAKDVESVILHNLANLGPGVLGQEQSAGYWKRSFEVSDTLHRDFPDVATYHDRFVAAALGHGLALKSRNEFAAAADVYSRGTRGADDAAARFGTTAERENIRYSLRNNLANVYMNQEKYEAAAELFREVLAQRERAAKANANDPAARASLAITAYNLATCHARGKPRPDSLTLLRSAVENMRAASNLAPMNSRYRTLLIEDLTKLIEYGDAANETSAATQARQELDQLHSKN